MATYTYDPKRKKYTATGTKTTKDANGNASSSTVTATATADDAKSIIDPKEVQAAIEEFKQVLEDGIKSIQDAIRKVTVDADGNMLAVKDATMDTTLNEYADALSPISSSADDVLEDAQETAEKEYKTKQTEYNDAAKQKATNDCKGQGGENIRTTEQTIGD